MWSILIYLNLRLQRSLPRLTDNINNRKKKFWKLRLYIDHSSEENVYQAIQELITENEQLRAYLLNHIEIFEYFIPELCYQVIEEGKTRHTFFHYSSIGMIMRFMPFIYSQENDLIPFRGSGSSPETHFCKRVIVTDADNQFAFRNARILELYMKDRVNFGFNTRDGHQYYLHIRCNLLEHQPLSFYSVINFFVYQWSGNDQRNYKAFPIGDFINFYNKSMNDFMNEHQRNHNGKISLLSRSLLKSCQMGYVFGYGYDELFTNQYILKYHYNHESNVRAWVRNGYYGVLFKLLEEIIEKGLEENEDLRIFISRFILTFTAVWQNEEDVVRYEWRRLTPAKLENIGMVQNETRMDYSRSNALLRRNIERGRYVDIIKLYRYMKPLKESEPNSIRGDLYGMLKNSWKHEIMNDIQDEDMQIRTELFFPHQQINYFLHQIDIYLDRIGNPLSLRLKNSIQLNKLLSFNFNDRNFRYRNIERYKKDGYIFYFINKIPRSNMNILKYLSRDFQLHNVPIENFVIEDLGNERERMFYSGEW
jgi:hypothetical protein